MYEKEQNIRKWMDNYRFVKSQLIIIFKDKRDSFFFLLFSFIIHEKNKQIVYRVVLNALRIFDFHHHLRELIFIIDSYKYYLKTTRKNKM